MIDSAWKEGPLGTATTRLSLRKDLQLLVFYGVQSVIGIRNIRSQLSTRSPRYQH